MLQDWFDLRSGLLTAEAVTLSAINRAESRGAHQREDFTETKPTFERNQVLSLNQDGSLNSNFVIPAYLKHKTECSDLI